MEVLLAGDEERIGVWAMRGAWRKGVKRSGVERTDEEAADRFCFLS